MVQGSKSWLSSFIVTKRLPVYAAENIAVKTPDSGLALQPTAKPNGVNFKTKAEHKSKKNW